MSTNQTDKSQKKILLLGDSISSAYGVPVDSGWAQLTQQRINQLSLNASLINQSINGETSYGGLARIDSLLQQHKPALVVLELGANDGLHGIPPEVIKDNLREIIIRSKKTGAKVLLLAIRTSSNYGEAYHDAFYRNYLTLAVEMECSCAPDILERIANTASMLQDDGLHPTTNAQPIIKKNIWPYLSAIIKAI